MGPVLLWLLSGGGGIISGKIPHIVEVLLSWNLALFCLLVSGRYYIQAKFSTLWQPAERGFQYFPLTTASRNELKVDPLTRYEQLTAILNILKPKLTRTHEGQIHDEDLIMLCRDVECIRKLVSLMMRPYNYSTSGGRGEQQLQVKDYLMIPASAILFVQGVLGCFRLQIADDLKSVISHEEIQWSDSLTCFGLSAALQLLLHFRRQKRSTTKSLHQIQPNDLLIKQLVTLWPHFLELPSTGSYEIGQKFDSFQKQFSFDISLIVPVYGEDGKALVDKLRIVEERCSFPAAVELILVDAGNNTRMDCLNNETFSIKMRKVQFLDGTGRGPTLNYGASLAKGKYLVFLHSDTTMPHNWDAKISDTLSVDGTTMCAFSFGIGQSSIPGIKAVEFTANLRSHMYKLPYGDQVLSIPSTIFRFLGGFPHQCLMEDYELVDIVRRRMIHSSSSWFGGHNKEKNKETLQIIGGEPSRCSPRRWEKLGVLKVTYTNSLLVNLYKSLGIEPTDIFEMYYGKRCKESPAPWEKDILIS